MAVRVTLAGHVGIEVDGVDVAVDVLGRPGRLALAYLACERRRPVPRDELAEVLWGDDLPRSWEQLLRGIVSKLRACLSAAGLDPTRALTTAFGAYQIHLPPDATLDVEEAAAALDAAVAAADAARSSELAAAAVAVAGRQFLPGGSGPWVERRQAELREVHLRALEALGRAAEAQARWADAAAAAEEAVAIEPFRESAYVVLMSAHAGAGNRGEALRAYERCRRHLADELGVNPSPATETAYLGLLGDEPAVAPTPRPAPGLFPLPQALAAGPGGFLVGREREAAGLADAFGRAATEGGRAVMVGGEPGIGKTALVAAFARAAHAEGARVLYGRCDEELGLAYQAFAGAVGHYVAHGPIGELAAHVRAHGGELRRLTPELARRLPDAPSPPSNGPEADRFQMFEATAALLSAASAVAPVVVVVDDLHWAANATLLMLRHLVRATGRANVLIVATYRHTEIGPGHPLTDTLADLRREPGLVERIALEGLDEDGVAAFVDAAEGGLRPGEGTGLVNALHAHTAGNPFFVGELLRHLAETGAVYRRQGPMRFYQDAEGLGVPEGVREVVARRLRRLSEAANRALVMASVIGAEFELDLLESVVDPAGLLDAVEEAVGARLVVEIDHGRYLFAHALVRDTIYSGLTTTRRGRLHRHVAEALEPMPGDEGVRVPALAHHFAEAASAGCALKAADYALAAARQAIGQAAWEDAVARLERGLKALEGVDPPDLERRCDLLLLLAEAWTRFFDPARARAAAAPAVEAARALRSPVRLGQAVYWYTRESVGGAREEVLTDAADVLEEALRALGAEMPALRARVLVILAARQPQHHDGEAMRREALVLARRSGDHDALGVALGAACAALRGSPRLREFLALAEELVSAAPPDGWDGWRSGHEHRGKGRLSAGDRSGFEADLVACERLGAERRFWYFQWIAAMWRATLALLDGRFAEVDALAAVARDVNVLAESGPQFFLRQVFKVRLEQGDLVAARSAAIRLMEKWPSNHLHRAMLGSIEAELAGTDGDRHAAEAFANADLGPMLPERWPVTLAYQTEVAVALGGADRAARLYATFEPYREQVVIGGMGDGCMGAVDRYLGMLAAVAGRRAQAEAHYETALRIETGLRSPPLLARTRYWHGRMLIQLGGTADRGRAEELLALSRDTAERLGMAQLSAQARTLLSRA